MPNGVPDMSESLENVVPAVRAAILGKGERAPVIAANDNTVQVEHFDMSMAPDEVASLQGMLRSRSLLKSDKTYVCHLRPGPSS